MEVGLVSKARQEQLSAELLRIIATKGLHRLDAPIELASGAMSADFVDGKEALAKWSDLRVAAEAIVATVTNAGLDFNAVGGLSLGADALAVGVAAVADCSWFFVRKEPKGRGTRRQVEGARIGSGDRVLLVDDAVTTAGSILLAYNIVAQTGATIAAAVTLVDRGESAKPKFLELGCPYFPMTTYQSLGIAPV